MSKSCGGACGLRISLSAVAQSRPHPTTSRTTKEMIAFFMLALRLLLCGYLK